MATHLYCHIIKQSEDEYDLVALSVDKTEWYALPDTLKNLNDHKELLSLKSIASCIKSISKVGGFRKICIKLNENLKFKYMDEESNFCVNKHYLEEVTTNVESSRGEENSEKFLINKIKELENRLAAVNDVSLVDVEKKFVITKFNGKQDPLSWIEGFEKECMRYKITND